MMLKFSTWCMHEDKRKERVVCNKVTITNVCGNKEQNYRC